MRLWGHHILKCIATTGRVSLCVQMKKLTAFLELESATSAAQAAFWKMATKFRVRSLGVISKAAYQATPYVKIR